MITYKSILRTSGQWHRIRLATHAEFVRITIIYDE